MRRSVQQPNIILLVLDTHRWDRLGCYGYGRGTSPNVDAFADEATLFEHGIAPAQWTIPSHASMFSGEPPSVHGALQSDDVLDPQFKTLAERLRTEGYRTVGFCNNPLVGVLDNGLRRGFDAFYNYCGAFPSGPNGRSHSVFSWMQSLASRSLQKIAAPIQNAFANSNALFQGALDPFWVPIWTWIANFKGNTPRSIRDASRYIEQHVGDRHGEPHFLFVNLMETHLPYTPPKAFVERFAPSWAEGGHGRDFMQRFNRRAADWFTPPAEPFSEEESETLGQMYDAEVAYQDHLLGQLLEVLDRPVHRDNTLVILVGDHGEMLGEHQLMGHGFGVYEELVHVPLLIRSPGQGSGERVTDPVSVTRLFHTALEAAGVLAYEDVSGQRIVVHEYGLDERGGACHDVEPVVVSEAYAPAFALEVMEERKRAVIDKLHCRATHRAAYQGEHKLISIEGVGDRLFSLRNDPREMNGSNGQGEAREKEWLAQQLASFLEMAERRRPDLDPQRAANMDDTAVQQRLRDLGYLE